MGRLIDIDAFEEKFIKEHELYFKPSEAKAVHCIFDALHNAPTAYDAEKVIEQIRDCSNWCNAEMMYPEVAEEIVRKGGAVC